MLHHPICTTTNTEKNHLNIPSFKLNHLAHFQAHSNISKKKSSTKPSSMNIMLVNYQLQSILSCDKHLNNSIMSDKSNNVNGFSRMIIMRIKIELYFFRIVFIQLCRVNFYMKDVYLFM
ncbi:hypothetical protein ACKWTF_010452 [Chironomus riparius]